MTPAARILRTVQALGLTDATLTTGKTSIRLEGTLGGKFLAVEVMAKPERLAWVADQLIKPVRERVRG